MSATAIFQFLTSNLGQYPELIVAAVLSLFLFRREGAFNLPAWLTQPAQTVLSSLPGQYLGWLHRRQVWTGWRSNTAYGALAALKIYVPMLFVLTGLFLPLWMALPLTAIAFFLPDMLLHFMSARRRQRIKESLPQALDLMVLCVDAGLGLDATLQRISSDKSAICQELNDELVALSRDVLLGMDREKAYQELYERTGVQELRSLGSSLNQSAKLGISIAKILRGQSDYLRKTLAQKAEEQAAKLPIYMSFPLWFCIMPALMVILLAPSFIIFFDQIRPMMFK